LFLSLTKKEDTGTEHYCVAGIWPQKKYYMWNFGFMMHGQKKKRNKRAELVMNPATILSHDQTTVGGSHYFSIL
jgi:hypothetical protein